MRPPPAPDQPKSVSKAGAGDRLLDRMELVALGHVGIFMLVASWGFGGNAPWSWTAMAWWGSLAPVITFFTVRAKHSRARDRLSSLSWLWPAVLFSAVVLASLLNPNFHQMTMQGEVFFGKTGGLPHAPSSARPELAWRALWLFEGIYLSCFNLALCVRRRRALRIFLLVVGTNALALAVFGSVQKFVGSPGLYFGRVPSPQVFFFASFIYHNHWGAFAVLMTAVCLGLLIDAASRVEQRDFWHSPAFGGLVAVFFLAASIPLSTSRSCTALVLVLLGGAMVQWILRTVRRRRRQHLSAAPPLLGAMAAFLIAAVAIYEIAEVSIAKRIADTQLQITQIQASGSIGSRAVLYRDTWTMARDRLLFGWGMASYPTVFYLYNSHPVNADRLPSFYYDAHSDWLQSLAELGVVGTVLLGLHGLVPLISLRRRFPPGSLPTYLFAGCALILCYAWVEFPFGCPAVVLAWWLCFFTGVRYTRLESRDDRS